MSIVMDMTSYKIESRPAEAEYGEEVMCAGWNPSVTLACQQTALEQAGKQKSMPANIALADVESFLKKMYACQR